MPSPGPARHPFRVSIPSMPVPWTISQTERLVVAVAGDKVTVSDIERHFVGVTADGAMRYRKIFEIAHIPQPLSDEDLRALGPRMALHARHGQVGPLPIVAASDIGCEQAKTFATADSARRPLALFRKLHLARHGLEAQVLPDV